MAHVRAPEEQTLKCRNYHARISRRASRSRRRSFLYLPVLDGMPPSKRHGREPLVLRAVMSSRSWSATFVEQPVDMHDLASAEYPTAASNCSLARPATSRTPAAKRSLDAFVACWQGTHGLPSAAHAVRHPAFRTRATGARLTAADEYSHSSVRRRAYKASRGWQADLQALELHLNQNTRL